MKRMKPKQRIVHWNLFVVNWLSATSTEESKTDPTLGSRFLAVIGRTVPPMEEPMATNPIARPRRFLNQ